MGNRERRVEDAASDVDSWVLWQEEMTALSQGIADGLAWLNGPPSGAETLVVAPPGLFWPSKPPRGWRDRA
jgi:hypothetical protein